MKFGFDIHGVITEKPEMFCALTNMLVREKHEVHILTGPKFKEVESILKDNDIAYTHFFSIVEDAEKNDITIKWDSEGHPWISPEFWDRSKARYCKEQGIDLHIDDTEDYIKHFHTPVALFKRGK